MQIASSLKEAEPLPVIERLSSEVAVDNIICILANTTAMPFRFYQNKFRCFFCRVSTLDAEPLREHTLAEHSDADIDEYVRHNVTRRGSHVKVDITNLSCKICRETASDLDDMIKHLSEEHKLKHDSLITKCVPFKLSSDFACLTCGDKYDFFGSLLKHMNRHIASWPCEVCGASFTSRSGVSQHAANMHSGSGYKCDICHKVCATKNAKRHHDATHYTDWLKCKQCDMKFSTSYERRKHFGIAHDVKLKHKCPHCEKSFIIKSVLVNHVKYVHLKEENHSCQVCGDRFFKKYNLQIHMLRHQEEKTFSCDYCNKKFARKQTLEVHVRMHTKDKRCVCNVCGKAYIQVAGLKRHLRVEHPGQC